MPTQYLSIKNVTEQTKRYWAVKVQILEKCHPVRLQIVRRVISD